MVQCLSATTENGVVFTTVLQNGTTVPNLTCTSRTGYWLSYYCLLYISIYELHVCLYSNNLGALSKSNLGAHAHFGRRPPKKSTPAHD
jgi:hypothetical protein